MKKILIGLIILTAMSCSDVVKQPPQKPFIITFKFPNGAQCNKDWCSYEYTDAVGNVVHFCEDELRYSIGDTIH